MADIDIDRIAHLLIDIRDERVGDGVYMIHMRPGRATWASVTSYNVWVLSECGAVPGHADGERYCIRSVIAHLVDGSEVDVTTRFLRDGWAEWSRQRAQSDLNKVLASLELHAAPVADHLRISACSMDEEDQDAADEIAWQSALDADGDLDPKPARPAADRQRFLQEPDAPSTRPAFLRRNGDAGTSWVRLLA